MQHIKNIVMILFVVLLAGFHVSACSSAANSQQIAKELADELTDAFDFDNSQIVDGLPPEGDLGINAPQINSGETENELTLGEPFVLTLYSNFEDPEEVDRVIVHVVNSKKYIVLKRGLITRPDQNFVRIGGLIRENSALKNNDFALHISLMTKSGVLGKPFIWKLDVSNRDAIIPDKSELSDTLESGDWNNDGKPEGDIADDAPQIARIIAPEIMPLNVARNIMIFTNNINDGSEITKVILATLSSDGFLVRDDFEVTGAEGGFFFKLPIRITNADLLNTKVILNLALQNNDGKTGQYYPWVFLVTRDSIQIDGDTDDEITTDGDVTESVIKPICDCNTQTDCCPDGCEFAVKQTVCKSGVDDENIWTGTCVDGICVDLYSKTLLEAYEKNVSQVKFSPAKEELISIGTDSEKTIKLWKYEESDNPELTINGSADGFSPTQIAYDPDGKSIAIIEEASALWRIIGYDLIAKSFQFIHFSRTTPTANSLAYSTDGQFLAFAIPDKNQIGFKRLNAIQNVTTVLKTLDNISVQNPREIGFSNSGELLWADYSADTAGAVLLYNVSENKTPDLFSQAGESNTTDLVKMSPDGSMLVTTNCLGIDTCLKSKIIFLNAKDGSVISSLDMPDVVTDIEFSPDGSYIAASYCDQFINLRSVCNQSSIALIVVNSLQTIRLMQKHTDIISDIAFSKDGTKLASGDMLGNIILWDLQPLMPEWFFVCYDDESCNTGEYCNLFTHRCIMDQCADLQDNDNDLSDASPNTTGSDMDDLDCQEGGKLEIGGNEEIDVK